MTGHGARPVDGPEQHVARATTPQGVVARARSAAAPLVTGALVAGACAALVLRDPHQQGSWGVCPLSALTGVLCPACGALRATHDLLVGDLADAWAMNPLWVVLAPLVVLVWLRWLVRAWQGRSAATGLTARQTNIALAAAAVVLVLYTVARNVPAWSGWLAPGVGG